MNEDSLKMKVFFKWAWKFRPIYCECGCGKKLPKEINTCCMDHLLTKSKYPECKYSLKNIMFLTSECHANRTQGFPNEVQKLRISEASDNIEELREESRKFEEKVDKLLNGGVDI